MNQDSSPSDTSQPVAYDTEGRPLYATPQPVHMTRPVVPDHPVIPPEIRAKHEESAKRYPALNLSEEEYVIKEVERHPIGLVLPVAMAIVLLGLLWSLAINFPFIMDSLGFARTGYGLVLLGTVLLTILVGIGLYMVVWVYSNNRFFLTNESIIQEIQKSLFSHREQTVSLEQVEDVSYSQIGMLPMLLNYGSIRLSTIGEENTYRFNYVRDPKHQIALLNNAVESFKNGRPIERHF